MATNNKLLRVTQMDAVHLDNEVYKILLQLVRNCLTYLPPGYTALYEPEIHLLVKMCILNYSILKNGNTFGQKLLAIKYQNITETKKMFYLILNCLDYLKYRFEMIPSFHNTYKSIMRIDAFIKILGFVNLSIFLKSGEKPRFIERILCLNQVYARENVQREYGSKYMTRELLWNGFIEILVHVLPLINYQKIKRIIRNVNPFHKKLIYSQTEEGRTFTVRTYCAYCNKPPVLPHHMGCPHIFCYTCLKGNMIADSKYECPICEHSNVLGICERVTVS